MVSCVKNKDEVQHIMKDMTDCSQEQAKTRLFAHHMIAVKHSYITNAIIVANDIDIVVIAVAAFSALNRSGLHLRVGYGVGKS